MKDEKLHSVTLNEENKFRV